MQHFFIIKHQPRGFNVYRTVGNATINFSSLPPHTRFLLLRFLNLVSITRVCESSLLASFLGPWLGGFLGTFWGSLTGRPGRSSPCPGSLCGLTLSPGLTATGSVTHTAHRTHAFCLEHVAASRRLRTWKELQDNTWGPFSTVKSPTRAQKSKRQGTK